MTELKFRAWDKDDVKYVSRPKELYCELAWEVGTKKFGIEQMVPERYIIEQYTGLKDKNGKEIYEGDIVRYWSENYEVKFDEIKDSDITYYYLGWAMGELSLYEAASMCEVIGNIHENPELLGDEE